MSDIVNELIAALVEDIAPTTHLPWYLPSGHEVWEPDLVAAIRSLQSRLAAIEAERDELVKAVRRNWGARPIPADLAHRRVGLDQTTKGPCRP